MWSYALTRGTKSMHLNLFLFENFILIELLVVSSYSLFTVLDSDGFNPAEKRVWRTAEGSCRALHFGTGKGFFTWISELQNKNPCHPAAMLTHAYDMPTPYGELALLSPLCRSRCGTGLLTVRWLWDQAVSVKVVFLLSEARQLSSKSLLLLFVLSLRLSNKAWFVMLFIVIGIKRPLLREG